MFIWNFLLKIGLLGVCGLILHKAISIYIHENGKADAKHILWWSVCMLSNPVIGIPGEYVISHKLMLPFTHILYDAIINGLILGAIYHGIGFTVTLTEKDYSQARKAKRNLMLVWVILLFLYTPYRLSLKVAFFYGYYAVRIIACVYYIGKIIYWFHIASWE